MTFTPQLRMVCGRCGKPRTGLRHTCVTNSNRKATTTLKMTFGKCGTCKRTVTNPLTHVCKPKSDFKRRKSKAGKAKARKKKQAEKHDYQACQDRDCPRSLCVAYRAGYKRGYDEGYGDGYGIGFTAGLESCPRSHA